MKYIFFFLQIINFLIIKKITYMVKLEMKADSGMVIW